MKSPSLLPTDPLWRVPHGAWRVVLLLAVATAVGVRPAHADETTRQVQEELRKRNLYFGDVDGRTSAQVAAALRRYQQRKGFAPTGQTDPETLRSLNLLGPAPESPRLAGEARPDNSSARSSPAPPPAPGTGGRGSSWPDITVLRSDEAPRRPVGSINDGREVAEDPEAVAIARTTPPATPAPPPASATAHRPSVDEVRDFLARYLQAGATNDPAAELRFYADRVAYYDEGLVDRPYISRDVSRYDHRWPERRFELLDPVTITLSPDGDPAKFVVNFRYHFAVKNPKYAVEGKTDNTWTLAGNHPADWQIVSMKEQRVRGK